MDRRPVAVLLHGAGSTGDFVRRAFAGPLADAGLRLVAPDCRRDDAGTAEHVADLDALVREHRPTLVGGVSRGAHVAALWASCDRRPGDGSGPQVGGLVLALPAWLGEPDDVARLSAHAADDVARDGLPRVLDRVRSSAVGWVGDELVAAWPRYSEAELVTSLRAVAAARAPSLPDLRQVRLPAGVVALDGDPFHPVDVARAWTAALPRAVLRELDVSALARDRAVLGATALAALRQAEAGGSPGEGGRGGGA